MSVGPEQAERDALGTRINAAHRLGALADARLSGAIADFFLADDCRLDERTRLALAKELAAEVRGIETDIRRHAARVLTGRRADGPAERILQGQDDIVRRLARAGLLQDRQLIDELLAQVRCDVIGQALPPTSVGADQASVLIRLGDVADGVVAAAARMLLAAEARRRAAMEQGGAAIGRLPAERHRALVWWIAAAIRETMADDAEVDRAIVEAALRSLSAYDEGVRAEAAATRLASAIDARADEVGDLLVEALGDRRLLLFIAVLAHAVGLDFDMARAITLEPEGDRLWLALRAAGLDRETIARIALALAEADPRRDIEIFADALDDIVAVPVEAAQAALAPLTLHHDMRLAIAALAREGTR